MGISIKKNAGVRACGVKPELLLGLEVAGSFYERQGLEEMVITSLVDGKHKRGSLHYVGYAADLRIWNIEDTQAFRDALARELGSDFDLVLESDHLHLEYQPKEI